MCDCVLAVGGGSIASNLPPLQVSMLESVPGVIHTIRMIHAVSRRYNTSERMTSLFVKVRTYVHMYIHMYVYVLVEQIWWK